MEDRTEPPHKAHLELCQEELRVAIEGLEDTEYWRHKETLPAHDGHVYLPWDEGGARFWEGEEPSDVQMEAISEVRALRKLRDRFLEALRECEQAMGEAAARQPSDDEIDEMYDRLEQAEREGTFARPEPAAEEPAPEDPETRAWVREHDRNAICKRIREGLNGRSDRTWSVTGGKGTAYGWLRIDAPPRRRTWDLRATGESGPDGLPVYEDVDRGEPGHSMSPDDRRELARLLGYKDESSVHHQGVKVPASTDYYVEYIDRAEGREPSAIGSPYWD